MKPPRADLFEEWAGDEGAVPSPAGPLIGEFLLLLESELPRLAESVTAFKLDGGDDEPLHELYRRGRLVAGFAEILEVPKLHHLLAIGETILDAGRELGSFEPFALSYLIQLIAETSRSIVADFSAGRSSSANVSLLVGESSDYVARALADLRSRVPEAVAAVAAPPSGAEVSESKGTPASRAEPVRPAAARLAAPQVDDSPEELDIPTDRVGLISDFCEEVRENLSRIGRQLIELESSPGSVEIVNDLFRAFHTVKGGSRMLRLKKCERLSHELENVLDEIRGGRRQVTPGLIDVILQGRDALSSLADETASRGPLRTRIAPVLAALAALDQPEGAALPKAAPPAAERGEAVEERAPKSATAALKTKDEETRGGPSGSDTIRIATDKLDEVLNTASEIFISRIRLQSEVLALRGAISDLSDTVGQSAETEILPIVRKIRSRDAHLLSEVRGVLANRLSSIDRFRAVLETVSGQLEPRSISIPEPDFHEGSLHVLSLEQTRQRIEKSVEHLEQLSSRLQHGAMNFRMVPISSLFSRFPTEVRTIARQIGKQARLEIEGEDTQLDKFLIGQLADPMLHLLRNSIDHGIELPEERRAAGKEETGRILLRASYQGSHAVLEIHDDGRGIDIEKVRARAVERGLVEAHRAGQLEHSEILDFIFEPGFSTAETVSELSGRGVGMDVVRTSIHQVQGTVSLECEPGRGTKVTIRLPLTLAVVWIVLVEEGANRFAFPLLDVDEIVALRTSEVTQLAGGSIISYRGKTLPIARLSSILGFPPNRLRGEEVFLVVLSEGPRQVGVLVDAIVGRQEVLIKNLGGFIKNVPYVIGCTILSDSRLVLILNPRQVVSAGTNQRGGGLGANVLSPEERSRQELMILVVEDSPIQSKHLQGLLKSAGYSVDTALNGFEALQAVRKRKYAAAIVDIVMPVMNGFEFVERMRKMRDLKAMPVFFVTSRTDATDRNRARSLGARGYMNKPVSPEELLGALDRALLAGAPA